LSFSFINKSHDIKTKTTLTTKANYDLDFVITLLLAQDETAQFISKKIAKEFVSPNPDPQLISRLAIEFKNSNYDIKAL